MKKVYLVKDGYNQLVIPAIDTEDVCFKSKKECEKHIEMCAECGSEDWKYCTPIAIPVYPRDNIAGEYMYIDRINYGIDYDFDTNRIYHNIQWSGVVYPSKEILKSNSGLLEYTYEQISDDGKSDDYVNEGDGNHIYNKYTRTTFDAMAGHIDYKIYGLKIV